MQTLRDTHCTCSLKDISAATSMKVDDIVSTLDTLGLLKVWKGQYVAALSEEVGMVHDSEDRLWTITSTLQKYRPTCVNLINSNGLPTHNL